MIPRRLRPVLGTTVQAPPLPLPDGVDVRSGRWVTVLGGLFTGTGPAAAVALGETIIVHPEAPLSARLLRHELEHVRQWREHPWSFPWRYAWSQLRHGYRHNPYEVAARAAETDYPDT